MSDNQTVILSFAEISFCLTLSDESLGRHASELLGVPFVGANEPLAQAGLSSLYLRGLAREANGSLELAPIVAGAILGVVLATRSASVALESGAGVELAQIFTSEAQSVVVQPLALGCFRIDGVAEGAGLAEVAASLIGAIDEESAAVLQLHAVGSPTTTVKATRDGAFRFEIDGAPSRIATKEDLVSSISQLLAATASGS